MPDTKFDSAKFSLSSLFWRATAIWLVIIFAETVHGVLRRILLEPRVGDMPARQISVFIGSVLIFLIALFTIRWLKARTVGSYLGVGLFWVLMTIGFEVILGRLVMQVSWERIYSDYDLANGGLMGLGLTAMLFSPIVAGWLRGER